MNKAELIDLVACKANITKSIAGQALEALLEGITIALRKGDPVVLANFGTFLVKHRATREGQNIKINAAKIVGFKAGTALKCSIKAEHS